MIYAIWGMLGMIAFIYKKNVFISVLIDLFIWIVFVFVNGKSIPDYHNYMLIYNHELNDVVTEPLYNWVSTVFFNLGCSYTFFRGFLCGCSLTLITCTFYKLTPYPTLALFMYTIYPMCIDVIQIRFAVGYSLAFYSINYLTDYNVFHKNRDIALFLAFVFLAAGFHYSCIIFLILLISTLDKNKYLWLVLFLVPIAMSFGLLNVNRFTSIASSVVGGNKAEAWVGRQRRISFLANLRIFVSRTLPLWFSILLSFVTVNDDYVAIVGSEKNCLGLGKLKEEGRELYNNRSKAYSLDINYCLFICIFYICLLLILEIRIEGSYERLARLGLLISNVLITRELFYLEKKNQHLSLLLYLLMYIGYFSAIMFFMGNEKENTLFFNFVFRSVMDNNVIIGIK